MSSELFREVMSAVGSGSGTDYINLGVRLDGTVAHVEGKASEQRIIEEYASKVGSVSGVTKVVIDAVVVDGA